jgi:hypothetical protein
MFLNIICFIYYMMIICPTCCHEFNTIKKENIYCNKCRKWINYKYSSINTVDENSNIIIYEAIQTYHKLLPRKFIEEGLIFLKQFKTLNKSTQIDYFSQIMKIMITNVITTTNFKEKGIPYLYVRFYFKIKTQNKIYTIIEKEYKKNHEKFIKLTMIEQIILQNIIGLRKIYSRYNCNAHIYPLLLSFYRSFYAKKVPFNKFTLPAILFNSSLSIFDKNHIKLRQVCRIFNLSESSFKDALRKTIILTSQNKELILRLLQKLFEINLMNEKQRIKEEIEELKNEELLNHLI